MEYVTCAQQSYVAFLYVLTFTIFVYGWMAHTFQELKKHCEIFVLIINFIIWQNCSQRDDKCSWFFHSRVDYLQGETKDTVCVEIKYTNSKDTAATD